MSNIIINADKTISINGVKTFITGIYVPCLNLETSGSQKAGRTLTVTNGSFTDSFDGYAVHIYQIGGSPIPTCPQATLNMVI